MVLQIRLLEQARADAALRSWQAGAVQFTAWICGLVGRATMADPLSAGGAFSSLSARCSKWIIRNGLNHENRDFDDAFLIGSALIALIFAAAVWMTVYGLGRGSRWAFRSVVGLTSVAAVAIAAYAAWYISYGASADVLAVIAVAAAVPAALAATSFQQAIRPNPFEHAPAGRRNPLTRPALLLLLSAHALLVVPALACAWVLVGILVRQVWLAWAS